MSVGAFIKWLQGPLKSKIDRDIQKVREALKTPWWFNCIFKPIMIIMYSMVSVLALYLASSIVVLYLVAKYSVFALAPASVGVIALGYYLFNF